MLHPQAYHALQPDPQALLTYLELAELLVLSCYQNVFLVRIKPRKEAHRLLVLLLILEDTDLLRLSACPVFE